MFVCVGSTLDTEYGEGMCVQCTCACVGSTVDTEYREGMCVSVW